MTYERTPEFRAAISARYRAKSHGQVGTGAYTSWYAMKQRCLNPKNKSYPGYGALGVTICERWLTFENFHADMGSRPEGMTLDRIDGTQGYSPENCQWATPSQQNANRRQAGAANARRKLTQANVDWIRSDPGLSQREMARRLGVTKRAIQNVIQRKSWA